MNLFPKDQALSPMSANWNDWFITCPSCWATYSVTAGSSSCLLLYPQCLKHVCVCAQWFSHVQLFAAPWAVACQAPLSMEFSRQEGWSGLPFPSSGELPDPGNEPCVSFIGRQILYHCTTWEAHSTWYRHFRTCSITE